MDAATMASITATKSMGGGYLLGGMVADMKGLG